MELIWNELGTFNQGVWVLCLASAATAGMIGVLTYPNIRPTWYSAFRGAFLGTAAGLVIALLLTGALKETPTSAGTAGVLAIVAAFTFSRRTTT